MGRSRGSIHEDRQFMECLTVSTHIKYPEKLNSINCNIASKTVGVIFKCKSIATDLVNYIVVSLNM